MSVMRAWRRGHPGYRQTVLWGSLTGCQFGGAEDRRRQRVLRWMNDWQRMFRVAGEFAESMERVRLAVQADTVTVAEAARNIAANLRKLERRR